jgi:2-polyprenyl-6-methoxyphenol hydroxylase-like FAD-dependent oxidoreductase
MGDDQPIRFIVVGGGFGGLACAIELQRRGCEVHIVEKEKTLSHAGECVNTRRTVATTDSSTGDIILLTANATTAIEKWPAVLADLIETSSKMKSQSIKDSAGNLLLEQPWPSSYNDHLNVWTSRAQFQKAMYAEAIRLGVKVTFGAKVSEHWEHGCKAGIFLNGEKLEADAVIGADGVYSKTREYVIGVGDTPQRSGFAVYRSWFPLSRLLDDPLTHHFASPGKDVMSIWIGKDAHAIFHVNTTLQRCGAFVTHKDTYTVEESWSYPGKAEDMLECIEGWDPVLRAIFSKVPDEAIIDYKLLWRDPIKKWVSDNGRIVLIGDAAHPHLPTSGSGAAQALEDAATLGALVEKAGKAKLPTALKVFEKLR